MKCCWAVEYSLNLFLTFHGCASGTDRNIVHPCQYMVVAFTQAVANRPVPDCGSADFDTDQRCRSLSESLHQNELHPLDLPSVLSVWSRQQRHALVNSINFIPNAMQYDSFTDGFQRLQPQLHHHQRGRWKCASWWRCLPRTGSAPPDTGLQNRHDHLHHRGQVTCWTLHTVAVYGSHRRPHRWHLHRTARLVISPTFSNLD